MDYLNKWFSVNLGEDVLFAKCIDIEFETGFGPIFLMRTQRGYTFWSTKEDFVDSRKVASNNG